MKKSIGFILFILYTGSIFAQEKPEKAPFNPDFIEYRKLLSEQGEKKLIIENGRGYIPGFYYIHFDEQTIYEESKKNTSSLPASFDLRTFDFVTNVKDQGPVGACWAFSTMGAIESSWLKMGKGDISTLNLSEQNMATCHGFSWGIDDGGNDFIALAYLTRLSGPVTEESDPYDYNAAATCKTTDLVIPAYVPTATFRPKNVNIIKKALMDHGAVSASINTGGNNITKYYNTTDFTFYFTETTPPDHAVLIVGWDDDKTVTGGSDSPKGSKGAWIVKNSWGTSWGDGGYFYVSYFDSKFLSSASLYPERLELPEIDTLYYTDYLGATSSVGYRTETAYALAKYSAPNEHFIRKIGTFINATKSVIDIEIFSEFDGEDALTGLLATSYNNLIKYPGYYTFDIPFTVSGDFYIKIKYFTPGYNYPVPIESLIVSEEDTIADPFINPPGSYWLSRNGSDWKPLGSDIPDYEFDLCIRAYADRNTELNAYFSADKKFTCINSPVVFTDESLGDIAEYYWDFGPEATPETANTKGPHSVSFSSEGFKNIKLKIIDPDDNEKILERNGYVEVGTSLDIILPYSNKNLIKGRSISITAYGADNYTWSPETGLNTTTGPTVVASPTITTNYTVNGTIGTCTGNNSIRIQVVTPPANDDVCNAIELIPGGKRGPYSNINATVQENEPAPPEGDCNAPLTWCEEGGLHNSIWFWFTGPETGIVSIDTEGFDNQIAVYKAIHCDSILNDNWLLIAANDDYHGEDDNYAAALEKVEVIPDQLYFLQVDGSAGGSEGFFYITITVNPLSDYEIIPYADTENKLTIFPNPNNGMLNLRYLTDFDRKVTIKIFNTYGQTIYAGMEENIYEILSKTIDLSHLKPGFYFFELSNGTNIYRKALIINTF